MIESQRNDNNIKRFGLKRERETEKTERHRDRERNDRDSELSRIGRQSSFSFLHLLKELIKLRK